MTSPSYPRRTDRPLPSPEEAIRILTENGCDPVVVMHCLAVAELAVSIARQCVKSGIDVDIQLVHIGALLHDIGRSKTHTVHHAVVGADIARSIDLSALIISIIERHVGGGVPSEEASELGWPEKSYMPETLEEKIVTYADKRIENAEVVPIERTIKRFKDELGADHPAIARLLNLHREISILCQESSE